MFNHQLDAKDIALAIAENSTQGIVVMDEDGYGLYTNRSWTEVTGFTADDMRSKPVHDWFHHHRPDGTPFPIDECPIGCILRKNENIRNHRDLFFRKDGTSFHVSCSASSIGANGEPVLKILEIRDITEEVEVERRKDEFLAMLAHELRNPLAPIAAAADLLKMGTIDKAGLKQASAVIARQTGRISSLVDDLLDVSRVTRGLIVLDKECVDMKAIVLEAIEQVRPLVEAKRHWIAVHTVPEPANVLGDRKRLVQVLTNILDNAAKYTPDGGEITVSIEVEADVVRISVADNGIGMTAEMAECAFELFTQEQRTPDRAQGGLGIGLAIVRSIVTQHGGTVSAQSDGLDQGTVLMFSLPRHTQSTTRLGNGDADKAAPTTDRPLKIMVVDDSNDAAHMLGMLLQALGHRIRVENDPYKALEAARTVSQDIFFLDIGLPGMDGMELARQLRQQPQNARAMIVALTGYGQAQDRRNSIEAGFDYHLVKPANLQQLNELLNKLHKGEHSV